MRLLKTFPVLLLGACASVTEAPRSDVAFGWISGCWQADNGATREIWTESYDGLVFGHSVTRRDGNVDFFEDLRIETDGERSVYIASPGGKNPVAFAMTSKTATSATFENPSHDYPQKITYSRSGNRLTATTSLIDGKNKRDFAFASCT